jgi:hypothetical protein
MTAHAYTEEKLVEQPAIAPQMPPRSAKKRA